MNYCRNPDNDGKGIWCYLQNSSTDASHCNAPYCGNTSISHINCKTSLRGNDYLDNISHTIQGHMCQAWNKQSPNQHNFGIFDYAFPDNDYWIVLYEIHS